MVFFPTLSHHRCAALQRSVASFGLLLLLAVLGPESLAAPTTAVAQTRTLIDKGAYLASAGDCVACHTAEGGQPFAGGKMMATPFGKISTPNITPDAATGIGTWSFEQFYRVMHEGIGHDGEYLYPVMPFPWYTIVTQEDVEAIWAYLKTVPAAQRQRPPNQLVFPANIRQSLLAWREVFFSPRRFKPDPTRTEQVNRGDYLVNGLAHCGECHNGRPALGATSALRKPLAGGVIDNWYAPNISSDARDGIGGWSDQQLAHYLKTGVAPGKGIAAGPMAETVHSLAKLDDADLMAIASYLKTTPPQQRHAGSYSTRFSGPAARGSSTYLNYCASCHGLQGKGVKGVIPALEGNGIVRAAGPQSVIGVVLGGLKAREGYAPMLAIGAGMSDVEIADAANYVRQHWGNNAPPSATAEMVSKLRTDSATLMNPAIEADCLPRELSAQARDFARQSGVASRAQFESITPDNMLQSAQALVAQARTAAADAEQADLINGLTAGYCHALVADRALPPNERALRLGQFSELLYSAASEHATK